MSIHSGFTLPTGNAIQTALVAGNTALFQAYDVDNTTYRTLITMTANNAVTLDLAFVNSITAVANIDIGAFDLHALTLTSDVATGTAPLTVASTTVVTNLNAEHWNDKHLGSVTNGKLVRYNSTGTLMETGTVAESAGALSAITTLGMAGDLTNYEATNDGSPEIRLGSANAEELHIQSVYDAGAQTLNYVLFQTDVASATADRGQYKFNVDGTEIFRIDDDGVEVVGTVKIGSAFSITGGSNTFNLANGTASLDVAAGSAVDINANLTVEAASAINQDLTTDATGTLAGLIITNAGALKTFTTAGHTLLIQAYDTDLTGYETFITLTANNTPTCVLSSAVTGTTQTPGDNTTKLATTAFVTAAIATTDTLAEVLAIGNTTGANDIVVSAGQTIKSAGTNTNTMLLAANDTTFITFTTNATDVCTLDNITMSGTWIASGTVTMPALTLGGAIAGGDQTFTGVGNMTFTAGSILASGGTNGNTLLINANDTTFITLTTGATDLCDLASGVTINSAYIYRAGGTDVAVADGGTNLSAVAAGSVLIANTADTLSALTSTSGLKVLKIDGTTVSWNATTGTGSSVMATSPALTTPNIGVATATSVNKYTLTQPANGSTLTILDGKTLTVNNTITLAGTDAQTYTFPATSDTVACLGTANVFTAIQKINVNSALALLVEQDGVNDNVFIVDTANARVGINAVPTAPFEVYSPTALGTAVNSESIIAWFKGNSNTDTHGLRISQRRFVIDTGGVGYDTTGIRFAWAPIPGAGNVNAGRAWFEMGNNIESLGFPVFSWGKDAAEGGAGTEWVRMFDGNVGIGVTTLNVAKLDVISANASTFKVLKLVQNDVTNNPNVADFVNAGTGNGLFIDQNANGLALNIDKDCTVNDTRTWAMQIASDNAGTGTALGCGIDMSSFSVDEPIIKAVADAGNTAGTLTGQIAVDIAGTTYYIYYYTTSTVV